LRLRDGGSHQKTGLTVARSGENIAVSDIPDELVLKKHRDLDRRSMLLLTRRIVLGLIAVFSALGLANVFGQRPVTIRAAGSVADLRVYAPTDLRGGTLYSARFHITAHRDLTKATLLLDPGWAEGMSINTIEPSPIGEGSSDGRLTLDLGHIPAGRSYLLFMQFQVNPTNLAWHRPQNIELDDGGTRILVLRRTINIYP
jgi:hypothetical protein